MSPPAEGWFQIVLDDEGVTGLSPVVLAGDDGIPVVVYQREVEPGELRLRLAQCRNVACDEVNRVDVGGPPDAQVTSATMLDDGSPVLLMATIGVPPSEADMIVVSCEDAACSSFSEQRLSAVGPLGIAVGPNGFPVIAYAEVSGSYESDFWIGRCLDRGCTNLDAVEVAHVGVAGYGRTFLDLLPDGSPMLTYAVGTAEQPMQPGQLLHVVCGDPACRTTFTPEIVDATADAQTGLPVWSYLDPATQGLHVVRCLDDRCGAIGDVVAYRQFEGIQIEPGTVRAIELADRTVAVAAVTVPTAREFEMGRDPAMMVFRCLDPTCAEVRISTEELVEANAPPALLRLPDGLAVATRTGQGELCNPWSDECSDPDSRWLSWLELIVCRGDHCGDRLASTTVGTVSVDASAEPLEGDLVFEREGDIVLLESGATEAVNLTNTWDAWEGGPAWSPDGTQIAFHSDRDDPTGLDTNIYVMNADGSDVTRLTDDSAAEHFPAWSPDGTRLVFARNNTTNEWRHLVILDIEAGEETQLTDESHNGDAPDWSPDGNRIVFGRMETSCGPLEMCSASLYVIDPDGTDEARLTDAGGIDWLPAWSPDGTGIAFHGTRDDPLDRVDWNIYVVDAESGEVTQLTEYDGTDQAAVWSPDGTRILFQSDRSGVMALYTIGADGSSVVLASGTQQRCSGVGSDWIS